MKRFDFGDYNKKLGSSAREALALAIDESRKRNQHHISPYHLILALLRIEAAFFEKVFEKTGYATKDFGRLIDDRLKDTSESPEASGLGVSINLKSLFRLAWISSFQHGRKKISSADLIQAIAELEKSPLLDCLQSFGISRETLEEALKPRLIDPVIRAMQSSELTEDEKKNVKDAIAAGDYWTAYKELSAFYNRLYDAIEEKKEEKLSARKPQESQRSNPWPLRIVAALILLGLLILALLLAAEPLVAADASCASPCPAGCNVLTIIIGREGFDRLSWSMLGFGCNRHAIGRLRLRG